MFKETVRPSFSSMLNKVPKDQIIIGVEVGVDKGKNAVQMLEHCDRLKLYLVDIKMPSELFKRLEPYKNRVEVIHDFSVGASRQFLNGFFDYIYIDAAHDYENVYQDINAWYPKLKEYGTIGGHDFGQEGVTKSVVFFSRKFSKRVCIEQLDWWFK